MSCACFWVRWGLASEFVSGPGAVGGFRVSLGGAGEESPGIRWRGYPGCSVHGIFKFLVAGKLHGVRMVDRGVKQAHMWMYFH